MYTLHCNFINKKKSPHRPKFELFSITSITFVIIRLHALFMIRVQVLLCKLNSLKISDSKLFSLFTQSPKRNLSCPCCGNQADLHFHSSYNRMMITISNNQRYEESVSISRVICPCGHTHALIPDFLIPYGSYSLRFILTVLSKYLNHYCSVASLCDYYQISVSTLYDWKMLFINHYNLFMGAIREIILLSASDIDTVNDYFSFPYEFFTRFKFSFLQKSFKTTHPNTS